jgi:calcium-dependent protein kinase
VHTFIVSQIMTSEEKALFTTIFEELDHNHDGVISKLELQSALRAKSAIPEGRMSLLMRVIDTNSSGYIDLTEFIVAGLKLKDFFSKEHFEQAFSYFDIDHSGSISYDEIAFFLDDSSHSEESIKKIFQ